MTENEKRIIRAFAAMMFESNVTLNDDDTQRSTVELIELSHHCSVAHGCDSQLNSDELTFALVHARSVYKSM